MLRIALLWVTIFLAGFAYAAHDIIVESRAEGQHNSQYKEVDGAWTDSNIPRERVKSTASGVTAKGTRKIELANERMPDKATARFFPEFDANTESYVYITWPSGANAGPVFYVVNHAGGKKEIALKQDGVNPIKPNCNKWVLLGKFKFAKGESQFVQVEARSGETLRPTDGRRLQIYADAVRFTSDPLPDSIEPGEGDFMTPVGEKAVAAVPPKTKDNKDINWGNDVPKAMATARNEHKKVLVFFHAPDCRVSSQLEKKVFADPAVRDKVNANYVAVRLDHASNAQIAAQLRALRSGTLAVVDPSQNNFRALDRKETAQEILPML